MAEEKQPGFSTNGTRPRAPATGLLGRVVALILGAAFLTLAFMFSLVLLAVAAVAGLLIGGYLWWKSRALRKQMREQEREQPSSGARIIEGEVIRDTVANDKLLR
jgi:ABC-type bacteriocin/lantibiotic exporter with double-glycine peptidase domain